MRIVRDDLSIVCLLLTIVGCGTSTDSRPATADAASGDDAPLPVATSTTGDVITPKKLHARLKEKNPEYTGTAQFAPPDGEIKAVSLRDTKVTDLSPLAGLKLQKLDLFQVKVTDLKPLQGMPLRELMADETAVTDISPLRGMPLETLWLNATQVSDISPLADMPIAQLNLFDTQVKDLSVLPSLKLNTVWLRNIPATDFSPLQELSLESLDVQGTAFGDKDLALIKEMPVLRLNVAETEVTDLSPLENLRLTRLIFTPGRIKAGLEIVRNMGSLQELDVTFREQGRLKPAQFWARHDAGTFQTPTN